MSTRTRISLDGAWDFQIDPDQGADVSAVHEWRTAQVPMPWQAQFDDLRQVSGTAWYRRHFDFRGAASGRAVILHFGAVDYYATAWLNGRRLGDHEGGYLPFEAPVGRFLRPGRNEIAVAVTAPTDDPDAYPEFPMAETPFGKQSWYGPLSGIWQSVTLERRAADHITGLRLVPELTDGSVKVAVRLGQPLRRNHDIDLEVVGPQADRPADPDVQVDVLDERRHDDAAVDERLDDQVSRLAAESPLDLDAARRVPVQERVADEQRAVRPRRHRQVLDGLRDALVSLDEEHVAGAHRRLQLGGLVVDESVVALASLGEAADEPVGESARRRSPTRRAARALPGSRAWCPAP